MAYATQAQAVTLYGEDYVLKTVDRDDDGEADADAFEDALEQASSEMDSYLGARYDVPIAPVPGVLVRYCVDIAIYISSPEAGQLTEEKIKRYNRAIKWLEQVAEGKAEVPGAGDSGAGSDIGEGNTTEYTSEERQFTRTKLRGIL